ncbi:MAG: hypothetical protein N2V75_12930 [Methanophagales archaeon]|nr:hypothetical protein [Methanophagales archaeon]
MAIETKEVLKRIGDSEREIEYIKRDLMHLRLEEKPKQKPSLFGSVRGGDITEEMIEKAKKDLFSKNWNNNIEEDM